MQSSSTRAFSLWGFDCCSCSLLKPKIFEIINPGTFVLTSLSRWTPGTQTHWVTSKPAGSLLVLDGCFGCCLPRIYSQKTLPKMDFRRFSRLQILSSTVRLYGKIFLHPSRDVRSGFWLLHSRTFSRFSLLCCLGSVFRVFVLLKYVSCNFLKPHQSSVKRWQDWIRKDGGQITKHLHLSALNKAYYQHLLVVCSSSEHHFYINITYYTVSKTK